MNPSEIGATRVVTLGLNGFHRWILKAIIFPEFFQDKFKD